MLNHRNTAVLSSIAAFAACSPKALEPKPKQTAHTQVIHVGSVPGGKMLHSVRPKYPPEAKRQHIEGVVRLQAIITKTGELTDITVVSGHPMLAPAALEAVKQWRYAPTLLNGDPVEVSTTIDVSFTLSQ